MAWWGLPCCWAMGPIVTLKGLEESRLWSIWRGVTSQPPSPLAPRLNKRELQVALAGVDRRGPAAFAKLGRGQWPRAVSITCDRSNTKRGPQPQDVVSGALDTVTVSLPATRQVYVSVLV